FQKMIDERYIPEEWQIVLLSDVVDFTKKPRNFIVRQDTLVPFIPMECIPENTDGINKWQQKKFSDISSGTFVFRGDLLVAKITPCFENGKQAIISNISTEYAYATTEVWAMHPKDDQVLIEFIANFLRLPS